MNEMRDLDILLDLKISLENHSKGLDIVEQKRTADRIRAINRCIALLPVKEEVKEEPLFMQAIHKNQNPEINKECPECNGNKIVGKIGSRKFKDCPKCNGTGKAQAKPPKEWPKKKAHKGWCNAIIEMGASCCCGTLQANQALSEAWEVHRRVVGEKDKEIADLKAEANLEHEVVTAEISDKDKRIAGLDSELSSLKARMEVGEIEKVINSEPELPGDMPQEMFDAIKNDKDAIQQALRIAVKQTKTNILTAIVSHLKGA